MVHEGFLYPIMIYNTGNPQSSMILILGGHAISLSLGKQRCGNRIVLFKPMTLINNICMDLIRFIFITKTENITGFVFTEFLIFLNWFKLEHYFFILNFTKIRVKERLKTSPFFILLQIPTPHFDQTDVNQANKKTSSHKNMRIHKQQKPNFPKKNIIILQFVYQKKMEATHKMKSPSGTRQISVCSNSSIFLIVAYDQVRIYSTILKTILISIKLDSAPRSAQLSNCGKYFYIHDSNNNIFLYDTKQGMMLQQVIGAQNATKAIRFSKNSSKLIYGSTQMLCLWNIRKCRIDVRTEHWKNMSCYDVNYDGSQFVIGTYNGVIYVLDFIQLGRCSQIQIKRHKTCVAAICFHENKIISASHEGYFLISTISRDSNDQKMITYHEMKMRSIPKEIQSIGNNFYMFNNQGMTWFNFKNGLTLTGFTDHKIYRPYVDQQGKTMFVSLFSGQLEWWPASAFKTMSEIQKERAQKQKQKQQQKENTQNNSTTQQDLPKLQQSRDNRIVNRVVYKNNETN